MPRLEALEERLTPTLFSVTPTGAGISSLASAIAQANKDATADTILLAPGQYNLTPQQQTSQLIVTTTQALTIEGTTPSAGDTVIDASQIHNRAFLLNAGTNVAFHNLTIQHGLAQDDGSGTLGSTAEGGGILDDGGNLTLGNVVVQSNTAQGLPNTDASGGGIFVTNGSLAISNSVIQNNNARGGTGSANTHGGNAFGGGVASLSAPLTITNSTVAGNQAVGGDDFVINGTNGHGGIGEGGGIWEGGGTTIVGSTLSGNQATGGGSSTFAGLGDGGGAFLEGTSNLVNSTIADNTASEGKGVGTIPGVSSFGGGGGVEVASGKATFTNVTVAYNQALPGQAAPGSAAHQSSGGGIRNEAEVSLTNTLVALNTALTSPDFESTNGSTLDDGGHNLIGNADGSSGFSAAKGDLLGSTAHPLNPNLGPLQNNGGPTQTIALLPGSPAINAGDNNAQSITGPFDQRGPGFSRVVNGAIGIGAFQVQPSSPGGGVAPVGPLMLFAFGFGPGGQMDLFEVDQQGRVFALAFNFANFENPTAANAQFVNTDMVFQDMTVTTAGGFPALTGSLLGGNNQPMLMMTVPVELMPGAALTDVLNAWKASGA